MDGDVRRFGLWLSSAESDPKELWPAGVWPERPVPRHWTLIVIIARYSPAACGQ